MASPMRLRWYPDRGEDGAGASGRTRLELNWPPVCRPFHHVGFYTGTILKASSPPTSPSCNRTNSSRPLVYKPHMSKMSLG
jgi:hypothetical protein